MFGDINLDVLHLRHWSPKGKVHYPVSASARLLSTYISWDNQALTSSSTAMILNVPSLSGIHAFIQLYVSVNVVLY